MKISGASLLLAFTAFLQESKCMEFPDYVPPAGIGGRTGIVDLQLRDSQELTAFLYQAHITPEWVENTPTKDFKHYAVYIHTFNNLNHQTIHVPDTWIIQAPLLENATMTLGNLNFQTDTAHFHTYDQTLSVTGYYVNRIYVAVKGTREILSATVIPSLPEVTPFPANIIARDVPSGRIVVSLYHRGHFTADLFPARNVPGWLTTPSYTNFKNYEIFVHTLNHGIHWATYRYDRSLGLPPFPSTVRLTLGQVSLIRGGRNLQDYNHEIILLHSIDSVYIALQKTNIIKYAELRPDDKAKSAEPKKNKHANRPRERGPYKKHSGIHIFQ
ncbi:uncharacterized protein LOC117168045 [Belonocnema kinseyi]|uniref:uncharacterized protein LOC117168045 n=1 Tax=Belonocnema kinseyi TaxID=2817044 RepID=UPI00143E02DC|nr:uncharacterized protein LOC117168045 [Belonocnema kinseyi]